MDIESGPPRQLGKNWVTYVILGVPIGLLLLMGLAVIGIIPRTVVTESMRPLSIGMIVFGVVLWAWQQWADRK